MAVSCIVDGCLLVPPTRPTAPPYLLNPALPSGTLGKSVTLPAHPKNPITDPNHPRLHGRTLFFTLFWVVGKCLYACMRWVRQLPSTDTWEGLLQVLEPGQADQSYKKSQLELAWPQLLATLLFARFFGLFSLLFVVVLVARCLVNSPAILFIPLPSCIFSHHLVHSPTVLSIPPPSHLIDLLAVLLICCPSCWIAGGLHRMTLSHPHPFGKGRGGCGSILACEGAAMTLVEGERMNEYQPWWDWCSIQTPLTHIDNVQYEQLLAQ